MHKNSRLQITEIQLVLLSLCQVMFNPRQVEILKSVIHFSIIFFTILNISQGQAVNLKIYSCFGLYF